MKQKLTLLAALLITFSNLFAQVTDTVSVGAGYVNQVWYSLPNDEQGSSPKDNWDLGFEIAGRTAAILANTQKGLAVYQSPYAVADWATLDTAGISTWPLLQNADSTWGIGALNAGITGGYDLGWGVYDIGTHEVAGDSIFVVKLANGNYKKLRIDTLNTTVYIFTFADLDGSNEHTRTFTLADFSGKSFGYYSLENDSALDREPLEANWDITFTKYMTIVPVPTPTLYGVTGVLANKNVKVAKAEGVDVNTVDDSSYTFSSRINTIGYDWKNFDGSQYVIEDSLAYFVERADSSVWKIVFTGFSGSTSGNYVFSKQQLNTVIPTGIEQATAVSTLALYPNPAHNNLTVVYDYNSNNAQNTVVNIYDLSGKLVLSNNFNLTTGFNQHTINVSTLQQGMYIVAIPSLNVNQKLVIE